MRRLLSLLEERPEPSWAWRFRCADEDARRGIHVAARASEFRGARFRGARSDVELGHQIGRVFPDAKVSLVRDEDDLHCPLYFVVHDPGVPASDLLPAARRARFRIARCRAANDEVAAWVQWTHATEAEVENWLVDGDVWTVEVHGVDRRLCVEFEPGSSNVLRTWVE